MIARLAERRLLTAYGEWKEVLYYGRDGETVVLILGDVRNSSNVVLCRVHSSCVSAHLFGSVECDCLDQMNLSQEAISKEGCGVVICLPQEGRGNGHFALMMAAKLAREKAITQTEAYAKLGFSPEYRRYDDAADIVLELTIRSIVLLSNNPRKAEGLVEAGVSVSSLRSVYANLGDRPQLRAYYADKVAHGHAIDIDSDRSAG